MYAKEFFRNEDAYQKSRACADWLQSDFRLSVPVETVGSDQPGDEEHLVLGVSTQALASVLDFMGAVFRKYGEMPPEWYFQDFPDPDESWYIGGEDEPPKLIGYEVVSRIESFMRENRWEKLSLAEVLFRQGCPGVGKAAFFLSHCQAENIDVTLNALGMASMMMQEGLYDQCAFVDYATIRQCQDDFAPGVVEVVIKKIGKTAVVLGPFYKPWSAQRVWCVFEISCAIQDGGEIMCVPAINPIGMGMAWHIYGEVLMEAAQTVTAKLAECKSLHPRDKDRILAHIESGFGVKKTDEKVTEAMRSGIWGFLDFREHVWLNLDREPS